MLGQPRLVAVDADVANILESDWRAARRMDFQHDDPALKVVDSVEGEIRARHRHLLQPHDQRLVAFLAAEGIECRTLHRMRAVLDTPDDPGAVVTLEDSYIGQCLDVLPDLVGAIEIRLEFHRSRLTRQAAQAFQGIEQCGLVHESGSRSTSR